MTVYVLTQTEGKATVPVASVTSESTAKEWFRRKAGNDFYPLELDRVDHLGFAINGPNFAPVVAALKTFEMPPVPVITPDMDICEASEALSQYLTNLAGSMAEIQKALDA